ncbi:TPA: hypothetical protein N0F65_004563 [Lagenidium giganteum]|uniref:Uncharacterized protein n=1 Tax=Lagenidium giganteum TaxID=4803 RepID=A0AAV2ZFP2_9STRA|nr:TPA: hypothetical protein N0F65_004563 [Lagenidium giganteum]
MSFLCTGGSTSLKRLARRQRNGQQTEVPCPKFVKDYQRLMGGVDVHDQLRLQRYALQHSIRCQPYYKTLFFAQKRHVKAQAMTHVQFMPP